MHKYDLMRSAGVTVAFITMVVTFSLLYEIFLD